MAITLMCLYGKQLHAKFKPAYAKFKHLHAKFKQKTASKSRNKKNTMKVQNLSDGTWPHKYTCECMYTFIHTTHTHTQTRKHTVSLALYGTQHTCSHLCILKPNMHTHEIVWSCP